MATGNTERVLIAIERLQAARRSSPRRATPPTSASSGLARLERHARSSSRASRAAASRRSERRSKTRWGATRHRGDGHRRHRRLAVGRVRAPGRHAPRRPRLRPPRADRPGDRAARSRSSTRREGELVLTHLRHRAAPLLRFRTRDHVDGQDEPVPVRAHRPAHPLRRPHRRHADRPRRQRLPERRPRGRRRLARASPARSSSGRDPASSRSRRCRSSSSSRARRRRADARLDPATRLRDVLVVTTTVELVPFGTLPRSEYKSRLVEH